MHLRKERIDLDDKLKTKLIELQYKIGALYIASFNKEYDLHNILSAKKKGGNKDINVQDMNGYMEMEEEISKNLLIIHLSFGSVITEMTNLESLIAPNKLASNTSLILLLSFVSNSSEIHKPTLLER